jgi:arylsulfatase A-like enzyme
MPVRAASPQAEGVQHPLLAAGIAYQRIPGTYEELNPLDLVTAGDLEIRQMRATYFGLVMELDAHIGRIVEHLKATGRYDRTLIVLTSDHGEMLGEHFQWGKEMYFDSAFRVPLIVRDPRAEANAARGRIVDAFSEAVDVTPTILDFLGAPVPRACDGRSLMPFVRGETPASWRDAAFFEHDFRDVRGQRPETALGISSDEACYAVIRDAHYKYVHFAALPPLLFDIAADPHETRNLANDPAMQPTLLRYAQKMLDWRLTHADRTLTNMSLGEGGVFARP